jgi:hypothetical protein
LWESVPCTPAKKAATKQPRKDSLSGSFLDNKEKDGKSKSSRERGGGAVEEKAHLALSAMQILLAEIAAKMGAFQTDAEFLPPRNRSRNATTTSWFANALLVSLCCKMGSVLNVVTLYALYHELVLDRIRES